MGTGGFWGAPHPDSDRLPALSRVNNAEIGPGRTLAEWEHSGDSTDLVFLEAWNLPQAAEAIRYPTSHTTKALVVSRGEDHPLCRYEQIYLHRQSWQMPLVGCLLMEEQSLLSMGREAPHSHQSGQVAIVGTFVTPGIVCTNSYLSPHGARIGDHRFQIHDFVAHSVLRTEYPLTVRSSGQALGCKVAWRVYNYNKVLKQLLV